jgi:hypothetical protein
MKTIVVEAKGKKIVGQVADESAVEMASAEIIDNNIAMGVDELVAMLSGEAVDPTKKRCSRCVKLGRMPYHPLEHFSLLKNGKRHSQCKVCRVEQSTAWENQPEIKKYRKTYQQNYHAGKPRKRRNPKPVQAILDAEAPQVEVETKVNAADALFVGFANVAIEETN